MFIPFTKTMKAPHKSSPLVPSLQHAKAQSRKRNGQILPQRHNVRLRQMRGKLLNLLSPMAQSSYLTMNQIIAYSTPGYLLVQHLPLQISFRRLCAQFPPLNILLNLPPLSLRLEHPILTASPVTTLHWTAKYLRLSLLRHPWPTNPSILMMATSWSRTRTFPCRSRSLSPVYDIRRYRRCLYRNTVQSIVPMSAGHIAYLLSPLGRTLAHPPRPQGYQLESQGDPYLFQWPQWGATLRMILRSLRSKVHTSRQRSPRTTCADISPWLPPDRRPVRQQHLESRAVDGVYRRDSMTPLLRLRLSLSCPTCSRMPLPWGMANCFGIPSR
jgi:hypothetical protein